MIGVARACPLFTKLADRLAPISGDTALALKDAGIGVVGRYLENLTASERDVLFNAGLGILLLSEAPAEQLSAPLAQTRAENLIQKAGQLNAPFGLHLMIDLEAQHGSHAEVTIYDKALSSEIEQAGYIPLAYVGAAQSLSGSELYALPNVHLYWRGGSLGIPEPSCGFAIWQVPPLEQPIGNGAIVDMNITGADLRGRKPMVWYPQRA